jgi:hypothetical protein
MKQKIFVSVNKTITGLELWQMLEIPLTRSLKPTIRYIQNSALAQSQALLARQIPSLLLPFL